MSREFPEDLVTLILLRLPIKTLLRFTSVCKTWYDLINSSYFINTHLNFKNSNTPHLLFRVGFDNEEKKKYSLYHDNENIDFYIKFEFPFKPQTGRLTILGICNGLLCLFDGSIWCSSKPNIIIWNPFIRKAIYLPEFKSYAQCTLGFGYDFSRNDYKVVWVTYHYLSKICNKAEIYRLSTRTWEDISDHLTLLHSVDDSYVAAYVNGCVHWIGSEHKGYNYNDPYYNYIIIVGFDMHSEVFRKIMLPSNLNRLGKLSVLNLYSYQESLCLIHDLSNECKKFDIWFMTANGAAESWTKQFTVNMTSLRQPRGLRNNGDILWETLNYCIMSYHPQNNNIDDSEKKEGSERFVSQFSSYIGTFMESLALLDKSPSSCEAEDRCSNVRFPKWWD